MTAQVDAEDYDRLSKHKWHLVTWEDRYYAAREIDYRKSGRGRQIIYLHNELMRPGKGEMVNHRNHDSLDNRRANLRIGTELDNRHAAGPNKNNSSGYKGVSWLKCAQKYAAEITVGGRKIYLGIFADILDAARAYNSAALEHFGAFAFLNSV
jgi:hypothetical protein